ncbi:glycosyl hydrolase family 61-domain-containing protein [Aspergillus cavernicola]|uniref:AA9 family lytic polysaccharide monooxygenase n=1 Tax=Aspergillus cavernicola TaxID=176166 RepID=A0ABR4HG37_9EURO
MKAFGILALAAAAKLVSAHTTVMAVWINDEDQGLGNSADGYIRSPPNNSPVTDVTSTDLTCNVNGDVATAKTLEVVAGDKITFEWHHNSRDASDDIIDLSHLGPVLVYMAPTEEGSAGSNWVKIYEDGYTDGTWAVETLVANKGKHSVTVPDVPAGDYLFRPEIIALHEGDREGGAQLYMECVQFKVTSDGSNTLPEGVSIPGVYTATDPGILFNLYGSFTSYPIPGPAVWDGSSSGSTSSSSSATAEPTATSSVTATSSATSTTTVATSTTTVATSTTTVATSTTTVATSTTSATSTTVSTATVAPTTASTTTTQVVIPTYKPTTLSTSVRPKPTSCPADPEDPETPEVTPTSTPTPTPSSPSGAAKIYEQCGGLNFKGATGCASGLTCKQWNPYYYQCIEA